MVLHACSMLLLNLKLHGCLSFENCKHASAKLRPNFEVSLSHDDRAKAVDFCAISGAVVGNEGIKFAQVDHWTKLQSP